MVKISMKLAQIIKDILVLSITVSQFLAPMLGIGFGTFFKILRKILTSRFILFLFHHSQNICRSGGKLRIGCAERDIFRAAVAAQFGYFKLHCRTPSPQDNI